MKHERPSEAAMRKASEQRALDNMIDFSAIPSGWWLKEFKHLHSKGYKPSPNHCPIHWECVLQRYPSGARYAAGCGKTPREAFNKAVDRAKKLG
jgi:hypothetical protein